MLKKISGSLVLQKHRTVKIIFLQMLEERHTMLFSSLTHLYFSVVKRPKTEDSILPTCLFLYFTKVKNKKNSKYFNDESSNIFGGNDYWNGYQYLLDCETKHSSGSKEQLSWRPQS